MVDCSPHACNDSRIAAVRGLIRFILESRGEIMTDQIPARSFALVMGMAVAALVGCQPAGEGGMRQTAVDTPAIRSAMDSFRTAYVQAYNAADTAAVAESFARDIVYLPPEGQPITGRQNVVSVLTRGMSRNLNVSIRSEGTRSLGPNAAVDYGIETVRAMSAEGDTALSSHRHGFLMVAEHRGSGWEITRVASTMPEPSSSP